jgi:hypothetical protein
LLFSVLKRDARANAYALTSTGAVAALSRLRQQQFPPLVQVPPFSPKAPTVPSTPKWLDTILRQAFYAAVIAGLVLTAAITIPSVISWRSDDSAPPAWALRSSIGQTGTAEMRVPNLSIGTFTGQIPFVQQHHYTAVSSGTTPKAEQFVTGAREAQLASYVTDIGEQMTLKYLSNAAQTKDAVATLDKAEADAKAAAAVFHLAPTGQAPAAIPAPVWQQTSIAPGTRLASTVTFYACVGNGFCGGTASGLQVAAGHAACSYNLPFGTKFQVEGDPSGRVFTCTDRGALSATWVDVWFYDVAEGYAWQSIVGTRSNIVIVG